METLIYFFCSTFSLDPGEKEQLVEIIERLLADKTTLVIGSAVRAFEEVCPERLDLIHPHYRKLCSLLMDVDEWGQVILMNMLTRYARTQFLDPDRNALIEAKMRSGKESELVSSPPGEHGPDQSTINLGAGDQLTPDGIIPSYEYPLLDALPLLQSDYNVLVESCRFLLQSRNTASDTKKREKELKSCKCY
ncbi:unnamed protein product [Echinostoma caproni]|uniref:Adaptin_N domain-containing protein n=1 Tax=Echinostoma caproni TaxID=27848 RepID=A0A183BFT7_9TREM|nr:unnamed protein product [Echinostoma caproni]